MRSNKIKNRRPTTTARSQRGSVRISSTIRTFYSKFFLGTRRAGPKQMCTPLGVCCPFTCRSSDRSRSYSDLVVVPSASGPCTSAVSFSYSYWYPNTIVYSLLPIVSTVLCVPYIELYATTLCIAVAICHNSASSRQLLSYCQCRGCSSRKCHHATTFYELFLSTDSAVLVAS